MGLGVRESQTDREAVRKWASVRGRPAWLREPRSWRRKEAAPGIPTPSPSSPSRTSSPPGSPRFPRRPQLGSAGRERGRSRPSQVSGAISSFPRCSGVKRRRARPRAPPPSGRLRPKGLGDEPGQGAGPGAPGAGACEGRGGGGCRSAAGGRGEPGPVVVLGGG